MGKQLSKLKFVTRPIKNYNVEDRAFKVISREKPSAAPPHPSMKELMKSIKNDPELLTKGKITEEQMKKLSQVFVTSTGENPVVQRKVSELPHDRHTHEEHMYGYHEPVKIPIGKLSLRQILELLDKHETDPEKNTAEFLAVAYKMDLDVVKAMLMYFRPFKVHLPQKSASDMVEGMEKVKKLMIKPFHIDLKRKSADERGF